MKRTDPTILVFLISSVCLLTACRPQCEVVEVPAGNRDTLRYFNGEEDDVSTVIMPTDGDWFVHPEGAEAVHAEVARRGVNDVHVRYFCRGDRRLSSGPYENNMHDYRGETQTLKLDDGLPYEWRFVKHICSPLGGWFGVFEYDAIVEGDSIYRQDYWAKQEVSDRIMEVQIYGRFGTKDEQKKLRQEAFRIIASLDWLTANTPMGCE